MSSNQQFRMHPGFGANLADAIVAAEGGRPVGFPMSGRSGVSVGAFQFDLGAREDLRNRFIEIGVRTGTIKDRAEAERLFALRFDESKHGAGKPDLAAFRIDRDAAKALAESVLAQPEAQALIQRESAGQVRALTEATARVCRQAGPQARDFCGSQQGQLEIALHLHQNGTGSTRALEGFLRGETVRVDTDPKKGGRNTATRIEGNLSVEGFREQFRDKLEWGRANPVPNDNRHNSTDGFYRAQGIYDGSRARLNPLPAERFRGEGERAEAPSQAPTQTAQADDKIKNRVLGIEPAPGGGYRPVWGTDEEYEAAKAREAEQAQSQAYASVASEETKEQTTNLASGFAQPVAHRTRWNPDRAAIDTAIATLRAEDLPSWTKTLLGRDVLANGQDAAVKGFQRAINAATKPPQFDYRWGLGGRQGRIDVDGDLGPQTRAGFGRAVEKQGEDGFNKLYALDQFGRYVKNVDRGRAKLGDLEDTVAGTLGQAIPDAPERAQETLNKFHEDRGDPYTPLKIDGWVGPKTTEAFGSMLRKTSPEALTTRFARDDFWNDEDRA